MEPFNPIKRLEPVRQERNRGGDLPLLNIPDRPGGSPIDAFAKLLGVGIDAFNQWSEQEEEEQLKAAAELVAQREHELGDLYKEYNEAEKRGEIPKGYSPFLFRAVRRNIGGRMARKVERELQTSTMEAISQGQHIDDDFEEVYDAVVERVLQSQIGSGLQDVDTEFLVAFDSEAQKYKDGWLAEAYKVNGKVRVDEAKREFKAGLTELVQEDWASTAQIQDAIQRYKGDWRKGGNQLFEPGYMEGAIVEAITLHADNLIDAAAVASDLGAEDALVDLLVGKAEGFVEMAGKVSTTPFSKETDHNLRARNAEQFEKMDDKLDSLVTHRFDQERRNQRRTTVVSTARNAVKDTLRGLVLRKEGLFDPESGDWAMDDESRELLKAVRKRLDPGKLIENDEWAGIVAEAQDDYKRSATSDFDAGRQRARQQAVQEVIPTIDLEVDRATSSDDKLKALNEIEARLFDEYKDGGDYDDLVWKAVKQDLAARRKEISDIRSKAFTAVESRLDNTSVFTIDSGRFMDLAKGYFPGKDEDALRGIQQQWRAFVADRKTEVAYRIIGSLSPDVLSDTPALTQSPSYQHAEAQFLGTGDEEMFADFVQDVFSVSYISAADLRASEDAQPGGTGDIVMAGAEAITGMRTDWGDIDFKQTFGSWNSKGGDLLNDTAKALNELTDQVSAVGGNDEFNHTELVGVLGKARKRGAALVSAVGQDKLRLTADGEIRIAPGAELGTSRLDLTQWVESYNKRIRLGTALTEGPLARGEITWYPEQGYATSGGRTIDITTLDYRAMPLIPAWDDQTKGYSEAVLDSYLEDFGDITSITESKAKETRLYKRYQEIKRNAPQMLDSGDGTPVNFGQFAAAQFSLYSRLLGMTATVQDSSRDSTKLDQDKEMAGQKAPSSVDPGQSY